MKLVLKIIGVLLLVVVVGALCAYAWASSVATKKYETKWTTHDASFPIPFPLSEAAVESLKAARIAAGARPRDPLAGVDLAAVAMDQAVERGEHLVSSRVGCYGCHGPDFGGGTIIDVPMVAHWVAPNLTEGGITRNFTAQDWDRAVRHGVRHNGLTSSMPCSDFANLSDHELSDIVAFIKSRPAVTRDVGAVKLGPVFKFIMATDPKVISAFVIDHQRAHAVEPPAEAPTVEFGAHLAQVCQGCHGPNLSGGKLQGDPNMPIVANLTPDATGIKGWTEADFKKALRDGKRPDGSAISDMMPWKSYGQMHDTELSALWAYLQTLPAVPKGKR